MSARKLDLAIIGAGVSGLAAARQVLGERPGIQLAVFDRADQAGGRLRSRDLGGDTGIVELGAGRFNPDAHPRVGHLLAQYELATKPFDYRLAPLQNGLADQARTLLSAMCTELENLYHKTGVLERHAISLRAAAARTIGTAKFDLLVDMCGYDTLNHPDLTFEEGFGVLRHHPETNDLFGGPGIAWKVLKGGLSGLVHALVREVSREATLHLGHDLVEIGPGARGGHMLDFETVQGRQTVLADKVLFALPIWNVRRVQGLNLSTAVRDRILSVPLIKAYFAYPERWWDSLSVSGLCLSTPTMFRKVYFPKDANYVMIYCDGGSAQDLHDRFMQDPDIHTTFLQMVSGALPFGTRTETIPGALDQGCSFWPHGISFWRSGLNLVPAGHWQIGRDAIVCSDIFTSNLGWIEGALESADHAARALLDSFARFHPPCRTDDASHVDLVLKKCI